MYQKQVPDTLSLHLAQHKTGSLLACPIEADDATFSIKDNDQGTNRIKDCGAKTRLSLLYLSSIPLGFQLTVLSFQFQLRVS